MPDGGELTISASDRKLTASDLSDQQQADPGDYVELIVCGSRGRHRPRRPEPSRRAFLHHQAAHGQETPGPGTVASLRLCPPVGGFCAWTASRPGNAVRITCPALSGREAITGRSKPAARLAMPSSAHGAILVVEDQADVRARDRRSRLGMRCMEERRMASRDCGSWIGVILDLLVSDVGLPG